MQRKRALLLTMIVIAIMLFALPAAAHATTVMLETSKGQDVTMLTGFTAALAAQGYTVTDSGGSLANIGSADILVVFPTVGAGSYTAAEADQIRAWVAAGGGLMCVNEWGDYANQADEVAAAIGMPVQVGAAVPWEVMGPDNFSAHPIMQGVNEAQFYMSTLVVSGGTPLLWTDAGEVLGAARPLGNGRTVVFTDVNFFASYDPEIGWGYHDNALLALNAIDWLDQSVTVESDCFSEQTLEIPVETYFTVGHKLKVTVDDVSVLLGRKLLPGDSGAGSFNFTVWSNDDVEAAMTNGDFVGDDKGVNDEMADTLNFPMGARSDWGPEAKYDDDELAPFSFSGDRMSIALNGAPYTKGDWAIISSGPTGDAGVDCAVDLALDPVTYADHAGYYTGTLLLDVRQF